MKLDNFQTFLKSTIKVKFIVILLFVLTAQLSLPFTTLAQKTRELVQEKSDNNQKKPTDRRIALVIGNGNYQNVSKLSNPVNDARDMAETLKDLGFEVFYGEDQTVEQMKRLIKDFGAQLTKGGVGLFYYAGHGIQINNSNYLIPIEANNLREETIEFDGVDVGRVLSEMRAAKNGFNIVILDACRNNPFAGSWRSTNSGLASMDAPTGTFIAYATAPGNIASDGTGRNGLFTFELLKQMRIPNLLLEEVFKGVRSEVRKKSKGKQVPWETSSIEGNFVFATVKTVLSGSNNEKALNIDRAKVENQAWESIKNETAPEVFRLYLKEYPTGENAGKAQDRLDEIVWESARINWDKAKIQKYLDEFPQGKNAAQARSMLDKIAWEAVKDSKDKTKLSIYLKEFPEGESALLAKIEIKKLEARENNSSADLNKNLRKNLIGITFTYIPPGQFLMGSSSEEIENAKQSKKIEFLKDEIPQRPVTIKNGFWLSITEVTQEQWEAVMGNNPSASKSSNCPKCPIETVSWNDAKEFIRKLNEKNDEFEYRLPTEVEWEYAARAGTTTVFAFGNSLDSTQANFNGESPYGKDIKTIYKGKPDFVRNYEPNAFGLYDMHGNVSEWCEDIYTENFNSLPTDGSANLKGDSKKRVIRGGSWLHTGFNCRSANRDSWDSDQKFSNIGFRVAAQLKNQ